MTRRAWLALIALPLAAAGLPAQEKLRETPYYPLRVGTTWHYKVGDGKFSVRVARHEKVGDTLCALVEVTRGGKVVGSQHLAVTADGVFCHDLSYPAPPREAGGQGETVKEAPKPPLLVLKWPLGKDARWRVDSKADGKTYRGEYRADEQDVTVPAGAYKKAVRVTTQDLEVNGVKTSITTHYAEGVGMVKQVIEAGNAKTEIVLEKFEPGK